MLRVGLTGGIGAGKSAVASLLAERGAVLIDADLIAREVVGQGTSGLTAVVQAFGPGVLRADGTLDRPRLAALVFGDEEARRRLNTIVHPLVAERTARLMAAAPRNAVVVDDVPLLAENDLAAGYHLVVVVEADQAVRVDRLVRGRGMSRQDVQARMHAQAGDDERRAVADVVVRNDDTPAELAASVDALWRDRLVPYAGNLASGRLPPVDRLRIGDPDPGWPAQYRRTAARVRAAAGEAALRVDHVGPTSVPGVPAEDVLDVQLIVPSLAEARSLPLDRAGFLVQAGPGVDRVPPGVDPDPVGWLTLPAGSADPGRRARLHVRQAGAANQRWAVLLRDYLRAEPAAALDYARVLRDLAAEFADRPADVAGTAGALGRADVAGTAGALGRADFADALARADGSMLAAAEQWAARTGWIAAGPTR